MLIRELPILTLANMVKLLGDNSQVKLANNTTLTVDNETTYRVMVHDSCLITVWYCGDIDIDSNGWNSTTTINRLNALLAGFAIRKAMVISGHLMIIRNDGSTTLGNRQTIYPTEYP